MTTVTVEYLIKNKRLRKRYKVLKMIGEGSFGKVHLIRNKKDNQEYVVKIIKAQDVEDLRQAREEITILKGLEHSHIVLYKDDMEDPNGIIVIMEYCANGDMAKRIQERAPTMSFFEERQIVQWASQICKALQYLHSKNILHRDLKPANIFLTKKDVIKLGDFGVARQLPDSVDFTTTFVGTPLYISPEIVQRKPYNHKSDVWAAGCCIFELMALNPAVDPIPVKLSQQWNVRPMPLKYSDALRDVVDQMLTIDLNLRPSIDEVLQNVLFMQDFSNEITLQRNTQEESSHDSGYVTVISNRIRQTMDFVRSLARQSSTSNHPGLGQDFGSTNPSNNINDEDFWQSPDSSVIKGLARLGVKFNEKGELFEIESGKRFQFDSFSNDKARNQLRYEDIAEQVTLYVNSLLESKLHMKRIMLPIDADDEPQSFIYVTDDKLSDKEKLLVLVQGPGAPRAGQWSRKVIMNDSLCAGSQIPWIQEAVRQGYAVIVLNPNLNKQPITGTPIRKNEDCIKHAFYVWDHFISVNSKAQNVAFVAHSGGGSIVLCLASEHPEEFRDRVCGIAMSDSCLNISSSTPRSVVKLFVERSRNWVSSKTPLDTALPSKIEPRVSAGEERHEWTANSCLSSAFEFLNQRYRQA